jgi:hypothetical protein
MILSIIRSSNLRVLRYRVKEPLEDIYSILENIVRISKDFNNY